MLLSVDVKPLAPVLDIDFAEGRYACCDLDYAAAADIGEISLGGPGGVALTPDGRLKVVPAGQPRIVPGVGMLLEPQSQNILNTMFNAAPTTIAGWALLSSRPAGATLTVVDDTAALYDAQDPVSGEYIFRDLLDAGIMNGMVIRAYNPSVDTNFSTPCKTIEPGIQCTFSAYVRCLSGTGRLEVTQAGGSTPQFSGAYWRRVGRTHPAVASSAQVRLVVEPQSTIYIILAQLEPGSLRTSPIVMNGAPATRAADRLEINAPHWFGLPHSALVEVEIGDLRSVNLRLMTLSNPRGEEMVVLRQNDNTLSATQTGLRWRPRLPRVYGPGRVLFGHRVAVRGRALGCGGLLAHDPFRPPPRALNKMTIGVARDGSEGMNGWVRSIRIIPEIDDSELEALVAPPPGSIDLDMSRYVSMTGDDANDGKTPATAWRTLTNGGDTTIIPIGTHLFHERGGVWNETLRPVNYCTYRAYGSGAAPQVGTGQLVGVDENGQAAFRLQDFLVYGATQRGFHLYGGGGEAVVRTEFSHCGSPTDNNAIGCAVRGNIRAARAIVSPGSPPPAGATIAGVTPGSGLAIDGVYTVTCTVGGGGTASRWAVRRPNGTLVGTAVGNTTFNAGALRFMVSDSGADPVVGEQFLITVTLGEDLPYPTTALTEDFYMELCWFHDIVGQANGDDFYCEGVQGVVIVRGGRHDVPIGEAADAIQISRTTPLEVEKPAKIMVEHCRLDMSGAATTSGKGGAVLIGGSGHMIGCFVHGLNFCISVDTPDFIAAYNHLRHARKETYSWGLGSGGGTVVFRQQWFENRIEDCNRALALSGQGTLPTRVDYLVHDNIASDCGTMLYIDRPTSGAIYRNTAIACDVMQDIRTTVIPPGGIYDDLTLFANRRRAS
jgi:hypothetical protein